MNTNFKSVNQIAISRSPRPTTVKPITEPAENATRRPLLRPSRQAFAVLALESVAIFIPTKPERAEKTPPVTNANGTNHVSNFKNAIMQRITNIPTKKTETTEYCLLRYAFAPLRIEREIFCIFSVPSEKPSTFLAVNKANARAITAPSNAKIDKYFSIETYPFKNYTMYYSIILYTYKMHCQHFNKDFLPFCEIHTNTSCIISAVLN